MKKKKGLVGKFFHTIDDGKLKYQGHILDEIGKGIYLVEYFDFIMGNPAEQALVKLSEMKSWMFYDTQEDMRYSYEYGSARYYTYEAMKAREEADKVDKHE